MNKLYKLALTAYFLLIGLISIAQPGEPDKVQMADSLRASGKIYVVVAVVVTILAGIVLYLIQLDRKIRNMEKRDK
jgi:hypothetical protein